MNYYPIVVSRISPQRRIVYQCVAALFIASVLSYGALRLLPLKRVNGAWILRVGDNRYRLRIGHQEVAAPALAAPIITDVSTHDDVMPLTDMERIIFAEADIYGVPRSLARALLTQESGGDPLSTSSVGAAGLMQVMPVTAAGIASDLGIAQYDIYDPATNAKFGMYYLSGKLNRYGVTWGLAAYNWGPGAVDAFLERHPDAAAMDWPTVLGAYGGEIPDETRQYVTNIQALADRVQQDADVSASTFATQATSTPLTAAGDYGRTLRIALDANHGAIRQFTLAPGQTWSFGKSIAPFKTDELPIVNGVRAGGWCNLAAMYIEVADQLGLSSVVPQHYPSYGPRFPGVWLNEDGSGAMDDGSGDVTVTNTTDHPIGFHVTVEGDTFTVSAGQ